MGSHPDWAESAYDGLFTDRKEVWSDPLVVDSPDRDLLCREGDHHYLAFAPDPGHKANCSSSGCYKLLATPIPAIDALVSNDDDPRYRRTFLNHLRDAFRHGGFPGFARSGKTPSRSLHELAKGLKEL